LKPQPSHKNKSDGRRVAEVIRRVAQGLIPNEMSLRDFVLKSWHIIEPATPLELNWHHELIIEYLELAFKRDIKRLVFNVPPRTLKSIFTSVDFPAWGWTRAPWSRWICTSYSQNLATEFSVKRRRIIQDPWYQDKWGAQVKLAGDQNLKTEFENTQTGKMQSTSTGGTTTGKGGDYIVMDDPQDPRMAESEAERKSTNEFYSNTLISRLNNKKTDVMILVQQRLHAEDTTSLVLKEQGWTHVDVPILASKRRTYSFPLSNTKKVFKEGEYLQPQREGPEECAKLLKGMGSRTFDAQYLQAPTSETGNIIKRHYWNYYTSLPPKFDFVLQSWDMTFKDTSGSSFVSGQVWAMLGSKKYLLDEVHAQLNYPDSKRAMLGLCAKWPSTQAVLVEDKANGPAIIADLRGTIAAMIPVTPLGDKVVRAVAVTPTIEAGDCYLPAPAIAPWVTEYVNEMSAFPEAKLKDRVDAMSQALSRMNDLGKLLDEAREAQASNDEGHDPVTEEMGISSLMNSETEVFASAGSF